MRGEVCGAERAVHLRPRGRGPHCPRRRIRGDGPGRRCVSDSPPGIGRQLRDRGRAGAVSSSGRRDPVGGGGCRGWALPYRASDGCGDLRLGGAARGNRRAGVWSPGDPLDTPCQGRTLGQCRRIAARCRPGERRCSACSRRARHPICGVARDCRPGLARPAAGGAGASGRGQARSAAGACIGGQAPGPDSGPDRPCARDAPGAEGASRPRSRPAPPC